MEFNKNIPLYSDLPGTLSGIDNLDDFYDLTQPINSQNKSVGNYLYGINNDTATAMVPKSRDNFGYVFFTRPQLNLTPINLRASRLTVDYLTHNPNSVLRYIKCLLDPRLIAMNGDSCPLLDNKQAFIPIFTNSIKNLSGWPDPVTPTWTSPEGLRKEQWSIVDGVSDIYNSYSLTATFDNIKNEPITHILNLWTRYMSGVFDGELIPYTDFIAENEIDYNTRIYRLVLDETKSFVKKIAATGAAFPTVNPLGKFFDYSNDKAMNSQTNEITVNFQCDGACYNDPILIKEFNETVVTFNPDMGSLLKGSSGGMDRVPPSMLNMFNYRCYPWINADTMELQWWVSKSSQRYKKVQQYLNGRPAIKV